MNLRFCFVWIIAITFGFFPFAFASEDSPSPFPNDFYISDLPELPDFPELDNTTELSKIPDIDKTSNLQEISEPDNTIAQSITLSTPIDVPYENIETTNENDSSIDDISDEKNDTSVPNNNESNIPEPIFHSNEKINHNNDPQSPISPDKSLTEILKNDKKTNIIDGTWIEKLATISPVADTKKDNTVNTNYKKEDNLETLVQKSRIKNKNGRSNASVFDISGVMLRMKLNQVEKTLKNRGFQKINAKFTVPNFIKWRNEEVCSSQGVVGYERMQSCVNSMAKKDGYEYVYYLKYAKFDSKEEIEVYLTSNFTENKVYKIIYRSKIAAISGNSQKAIYMRNLKVYDFWKKINQKYGAPDNKENVTWGLGGNKPFLKANTGFLLLEDPMFVEMDYTRMSREDQRFVHSDFYNF